ncbi:MAG: hypothetical protein R2770_15260 [Acidimicrobiales bacterium]
MELAGAHRPEIVADLDLLPDDLVWERPLDCLGGLGQAIAGDASIHVVRDVHHDPVEEEIPARRADQHRRALDLAAEPVPLAARPPADRGVDVLHVDNPADGLAEQQERHHYDLDPGPQTAPDTIGDDQQRKRAEDEGRNDGSIAPHGLGPALGRLEAHHLVEEDLAQVIGAGTEGTPLEPVPETLQPTHLGVFLRRSGMPDEVEALLEGVAVVNAVVAEHPQLGGVPRGKHRQAAEESVEALRVEQRLVSCVVTHYEQAGHRYTGEDPQRHQQQRVVGGQQTPDSEAIEEEVSGDDAHTPRRGSLVTTFGDHI